MYTVAKSRNESFAHQMGENIQLRRIAANITGVMMGVNALSAVSVLLVIRMKTVRGRTAQLQHAGKTRVRPTKK